MPNEIGQFQLLKRLATGGMAEIFLARQRSVAGFERNVVVKKILPEFSDDPSFVESFLNEARLAAQLNHPNIVQIIDLGIAGRSYFIAMEYIRGYDASTILRFCRKAKVPLPLGVALSIGRDLLSALDYAHAAKDVDGQALGIVHRDVTPSNLLVTTDGASKVVDFGIAKATAKGEGKTRTGTVKGKLSYLAPEQVLSTPIDRRADVFSASIVLYELLSLQNPFRGDSEYATLKHIVELVPPLLDTVRKDVPPALAAAIARGMSQDREKRFQTCGELLRELERAAASAGVVVSSSTVREFVAAHTAALDEIVETERVELFEPTVSELDAEVPAAPKTAPPPAPVAPQKKSALPLVLAAAATLALVVIAVKLSVSPVAPPAPAPVVATPAASPVPAPEPTRAPEPERAPPADRPAQDARPKPAKKPEKITAAPSGPPAKVKFVITPWAEIEIDGADRGMTPLPVIELSPGKHKIVIRNSEAGKTVVKQVTAEPGQSLEIRHKF